MSRSGSSGSRARPASISGGILQAALVDEHAGAL